MKGEHMRKGSATILIKKELLGGFLMLLNITNFTIPCFTGGYEICYSSWNIICHFIPVHYSTIN